ncbi:MAG TPA: hypothetical protein VGM76_18775 [Lacipirellulaceae bacterium]|jgi:hypothetical protein
MRRFTVCNIAESLIAVAVVGAWCATGQAQNVPGYWAGDVSLAPSAQDNLNQPIGSESSPALPPPTTNMAQAAQDGVALTSQTRQALGFYGGQSALATLNQIPHMTPAPTGFAPPQPAGQAIKPFQYATERPTLSPYLNLYRDDKGSQGVPNYYAFVQPQLEEQAAQQRQQIQSQRQQRRGQSAASPARGTAAVPSQVAPPIGNNTAAHFMDTAQFYSGWRR